MRAACCLGLFALLPFSAHATSPQHAIFETYAELAAGKCRSVSLTDDGVLAAGPAVGNLADLGVAEAWSVLAQPDGSLWVGTAPDGLLLRVSADGVVKQLAKFDETHLYALAPAPNGGAYVGTSPDGKIYTVSPAGKTEVYFEPKEKYIWALLAAPDGTLYAGTGTKGKIYRITGPGRGEVWYASNETHIRALALDAEGRLLAGSSNLGYLYRITGKDEAVVLADTGKEEVNQIRVTRDGVIYFSATGTAKAAPATSSDADAKASNPGDGTLQLRDLLMTDGMRGGGGDFAPPKTGGGASALYRLDASLFPQVLWETSETILSLVWNEADQAALVGTGNDGYTYSVTPHGDATRLAKIESDSVTALALTGGDAILAASNPGRLFRLSHATSQPGIYESDVIDSNGFARWGSVTLGASDPGSVKILTRSGNTAKPDKTWYPWEETGGVSSQSPPARFEQVQLQISAGTVDKIDAVYLPRNLPPHIDLVRVLPVGTGYTLLQSPVPPPTPRIAEQLLAAPDRGDDYQPQTRWQPVSGHGLRTVTWKASDPNNDTLTYAVSWRKRGETGWHVLAKDLKETVLSWDTSAWADGRYELKVEACDATDNPPGEGLTDVAISRELVIDNAPPVIQIVSQKSDAVEFTVEDDLSGLASVTISTNGKDYKSLPPVDGILDAGMKRFIAKIAPGQTLFIRAEDGSGNIAGAQAGG
jgi:hypothetical protein